MLLETGTERRNGRLGNTEKRDFSPVRVARQYQGIQAITLQQLKCQTKDSRGSVARRWPVSTPYFALQENKGRVLNTVK